MRRSLPGSGFIGLSGDNLPHARTRSAPIAAPRLISACPISPSNAPAPCHSSHGSGTSLTKYAIASSANHRAFSAGAGSKPAAMSSIKHSLRSAISYETPGGLIVAAAELIVPFQAAGRGDTGASQSLVTSFGEIGKPQLAGGPLITPRALNRLAFPAPTISSSAAS